MEHLRGGTIRVGIPLQHGASHLTPLVPGVINVIERSILFDGVTTVATISVSKIAQRAGVSKSTVSLVLNNRPHVSEATRRRVLQVVEVLRGSGAPAPARTQAPTLLLIHPATFRSGQVFRELLQGLQAGVEEGGGRLSTTVYQMPLRPEHATHVLLHDRALRPDGVVFMGARRDDPLLEEIRRAEVPYVLVARQLGGPGAMTVGVDNVSGAREATAYLIALGHKRIAFLGGDLGFDYTSLRHDGYEEALRAAGLPGNGLTFFGSGEDSVRQFLAAGTRATAVVFVNDEHALHAIPILHEHGLRIPEDISVVGFDDIDEVIHHDPPLTSVAVPRAKIGYWAARVLIERRRDPDLTFTVILRTRLNIRKSCAPPAEPTSDVSA